MPSVLILTQNGSTVLTLFRKIDRKCTTYELFKEGMEWNFRSEEEKKGGSAAGLSILYMKPSAK